MTKRLAACIVAVFLGSIGVILVLIYFSDRLKATHGSFLRVFPPKPALAGDSIYIEYDSYYIAGATNHHIYLGNRTAPLHLLVLNMALTDTQHVHLQAEGIHERKFWSLKLQVDSPFFYLTDGVVPVIYKGNIHKGLATRMVSIRDYFRDIVPTGASSFMVKSLSAKTSENILGRITERQPSRFTDSILQKQQDGVFCTEGSMQFNRELNQLIYTYYYRNQFMLIDTTLLLKYRGNTIDTTTRARIVTATIASEHTRSRMLASPPFVVNKKITTHGKWLLVNSNVLARNEPDDALMNANVIDAYDLITGDYKFSFYVYHFWRTKPMQDFTLTSKKLIVLYTDVVQVYNLMPGYW